MNGYYFVKEDVDNYIVNITIYYGLIHGQAQVAKRIVRKNSERNIERIGKRFDWREYPKMIKKNKRCQENPGKEQDRNKKHKTGA